MFNFCFLRSDNKEVIILEIIRVSSIRQLDSDKGRPALWNTIQNIMLYSRKYQRYPTKYAHTLIIKVWVFLCVTPLKFDIFWNNKCIRIEGPDLESGTSLLQNEYKIYQRNWLNPKVIAQNLPALKYFHF